MDIKSFIKRYDPKTEAEWIEYQDGVEFLVAPKFNPEMKKRMLEEFTLQEALTIEEKGLEGITGKANLVRGRMFKVYAESVIVDWKGLKEDDKDVKFDSKKIHEWMLESDDFAGWVTSKSEEMLIKKVTKKEDVTKN